MTPNISLLLHFFQLLFLCECHRYIQKCCDRTHQLDVDYASCIEFDGSPGIEKNHIDNIWWLPPQMKFVSSESQSSASEDMEFTFNASHLCSITEREIVHFTQHVSILENGSLSITNVEDDVRPKSMLFPYSSYCVDRVSSSSPNQRIDEESHSRTFDYSYVILLCPCLHMPCVRMCCKWSHYLDITKHPKRCEYSPNITLKSNFKYKDDSFIEISETPEKFAIIHDQPECKHDEYHLNEKFTDDEKFWILPDGSIQIEQYPHVVKFKDYCIHHWSINGSVRVNVKICQDPELTVSYYRRIAYGSLALIGALILAFTLQIYAAIPDTWFSTIHIYYLLGHAYCMFFSFMILAIYEFSSGLCTLPGLCIFLAYTMQFLFIAAIFWLNVLCIRISNTFKAMTSRMNSNSVQRSGRQFLLNSIYVFGTTSIITAITVIADNSSIIDESYRPRIGKESCWFYGYKAEFLYFYFPVSMLLCYNLYLYLSTVRQIIKLRKDSSILGTNDLGKKANRLKLYIKLFGLMGTTWIFQVLLWAIGAPACFGIGLSVLWNLKFLC